MTAKVIHRLNLWNLRDNRWAAPPLLPLSAPYTQLSLYVNQIVSSSSGCLALSLKCSVVWNLARLRNRSHWLRYTYMPISKLRNFDIEVLYFDFNKGCIDFDIEMSSMSEFIDFDIEVSYFIDLHFDIEVHWLRYRSASILKILRYRSFDVDIKAIRYRRLLQIKAENHVRISSKII